MSSAEVVVDDGEVLTGCVVDLEHSINNVLPKAHVTLTWKGERRGKGKDRGERKKRIWGRGHLEGRRVRVADDKKRMRRGGRQLLARQQVCSVTAQKLNI